MNTIVRKLTNEGPVEVALYSLPPDQAVVAAVQQFVHKDFNTWDYPTPEVAGVRKSRTGKGVFFLPADNGEYYFGFPEDF